MLERGAYFSVLLGEWLLLLLLDHGLVFFMLTALLSSLTDSRYLCITFRLSFYFFLVGVSVVYPLQGFMGKITTTLNGVHPLSRVSTNH